MTDINFINPLHHPDFFLLVSRLGAAVLIGLLLSLHAQKWNVHTFKDSPLGKRSIWWIGILVCSLIGLTCGRVPGMVLLLSVLLFAIREASHSFKLPVSYVDAIMILAFLSVIVTNYYLAFFYVLPLIYFFVFAVMAASHKNADEHFSFASHSLFTSIWLIFGGCHAILLSLLNNSIDQSTMLLIPLVLSLAMSDVGGLALQKLQPNQTVDVWTRFIGNIAAFALSVSILHPVLQGYMSVTGWIIGGLLIATFGMTNSLGSSLFSPKKLQGAPRSGLSIIDAFLQSTIIFYYYLLVIMS